MSEADGEFKLELDEAALKELDRQLAMANEPNPEAPKPIETIFTREKMAPPTPEKPAPAVFSGLLAELASEVDVLKSQPVAPDSLNARQIHDALSAIFSFFNKVSNYANELEPEINRPYHLDARTSFRKLRWHGAFADYRKRDLTEKAYMAHVSFRVRLIAARPVPITRRWDAMPALKKELGILELRAMDEEIFATKPEQEFLTLELAPDFPVQIVFQGNYEARRIDVISRNLEGFAISAFELDPAKVGDAFLDQLGRLLLGRSDKLPDEFKRVNYSKPK